MRPAAEASGAPAAAAGDGLPDGLPEVAQPLQALPQGAAARARPGGTIVHKSYGWERETLFMFKHYQRPITVHTVN